MFHKKGKIFVLALAALIIMLIAAGCASYAPGNESQDDAAEWAVPQEESRPVSEQAPIAAPAPMPPADGVRAQVSPSFGGSAAKDAVVPEQPASMPDVNPTDRKIIKSAYMALDTVEFERTTDAIVGKVAVMGGYVESSSVQGTRLVDKGQPSRRSANFQIRIPEDKFEGFMTAVGELGVVVNEQITGQDITGQYFDTETRVRTLKVQEERLLSLLARADKLTDIIEIERELSRIRFDIESLTGTLKGWDHMVQYSRVSVDVYEVEELREVEPKPENWFDRIIKAFRDSLKNLVSLFENITIFMVAAVPYLAVLTVIGWGAWKILRRKALSGKIKGGNEDEK